MLTEMQIKDIERMLTAQADLYHSTTKVGVYERSGGYCQGIAFVLDKIGYSITWDNGKATVVKDD